MFIFVGLTQFRTKIGDSAAVAKKMMWKKFTLIALPENAAVLDFGR